MFPQVTFILINKKMFNKEEGKNIYEECPSKIEVQWNHVVTVLQNIIHKIDSIQGKVALIEIQRVEFESS